MTETIVESKTRTVVIGPDRPFVIIGERINPTGRKQLAAEMAPATSAAWRLTRWRRLILAKAITLVGQAGKHPARACDQAGAGPHKHPADDLARVRSPA